MPTPISLPCARALKRLGLQLSRARRRRRWTQQMMAEQIGASVSTVRRLEAGDPGVASQHLVRALAVCGAIDQFVSLLDSSKDAVGMMVQDRDLPKRVRPRAVHGD